MNNESGSYKKIVVYIFLYIIYNMDIIFIKFYYYYKKKKERKRKNLIGRVCKHNRATRAARTYEVRAVLLKTTT